MDLQAAGSQVLGAAGPPRGPQLQNAQEAPPSSEAGFGTVDHPDQERETDAAMDRLGTHSEEEGFAVEEEESDGELNTWELSEGAHCQPKEQTADLFNEDWDLELKADQGNPYDADDIQGSISQEIKPWVCCAPQGDMIYDPSWHHPPPLIPHYSKMVFETGQFDDAED
ncbi:coordinator of PRMT5 and differentiation stimulator isoform 1-T1 [Callospermophilus lateralis]|uniref:coordinator of PRMT5 and differentiation stimulator isoform X1 n=1 Tax=Callospermophilus lateralis TaxID=76772 RepID=UPI00403869FE